MNNHFRPNVSLPTLARHEPVAMTLMPAQSQQPHMPAQSQPTFSTLARNGPVAMALMPAQSQQFPMALMPAQSQQPRMAQQSLPTFHTTARYEPVVIPHSDTAQLFQPSSTLDERLKTFTHKPTTNGFIKFEVESSDTIDAMNAKIKDKVGITQQNLATGFGWNTRYERTQSQQPHMAPVSQQPHMTPVSQQPHVAPVSQHPTMATQFRQPIATQSQQPHMAQRLSFATQSQQPSVAAQSQQPSMPQLSSWTTLSQQPHTVPMVAQSQQPIVGPMSNVKLMPNEQKYNTMAKMIPESDDIYIDIQDYLGAMNLLLDKTKDTFISLDTVLTNLKPYLYKKK